MEPIYRTLRQLLDAGQNVALATIVAVRGSVPREVGAQMIIHPLGQHVGTIGGGCGEADVIRAGLDVLHSGHPQIVHVDLTEEISMQTLGVCGGVMDVFVQRWQPQGEGAAANRALLEALHDTLAQQQAAALLTVIAHPQPQQLGRKLLIWPDGRRLGPEGWGEGAIQEALAALQAREHRVLRQGEAEIFVEVQRRPPHMIIVGAGHIAAPLHRLAALCDFRVTIIDDRPDFANRQRFPQAQTVIAADIRQTVREMAMDEDTYVVLVTRGHSLDVACLLEILDRPLAYIGMIGSQRRVRAVFDLLEREQGIPRAQLARVYAPIGLPIAAQTPAEIAVSIMAEVINILRGGAAASFSRQRQH